MERNLLVCFISYICFVLYSNFHFALRWLLPRTTDNVNTISSTDNIKNCDIHTKASDNIDYATDAVGANDNIDLNTNNIPDMSLITLKTVETIERDLKFDEKVSLIYLLHESPVDGLQEIASLIKDNNSAPISEWVQHEQHKENTKWKQKLIEALVIVQDFCVLKKLGFDKQYAKDIYLPYVKVTALFVHPVRKALFCIFDNMTKQEIKSFLANVKADFFKRDLYFKYYNESLPEMYLLHFEAKEYITLKNLSNIIKIFKQMDMTHVCDTLEKVASSKNNKRRWEDLNISQPPSLQLYQDNAGKSSTVAMPQRQPYYIDEDEPGICLIINQVHFFRDRSPEVRHLLPKSKELLKNRVGTGIDKEKLVQTFQSCNFGSNIIVKEDLIHSEMLKAIREAASKVRNHSSLFVCILSHGEEGIVYGCDSCRVTVQEIQNVIMSTNVRNLKNKPKVLILQCCQGLHCQKIEFDEVMDSESDIEIDGATGTDSVPKGADMFTFSATIPGYSAIRHTKEGSWFIQTFCDMMLKLGPSSHFDEICTATIDKVLNKRWITSGEERCMVPLKTSSLSKNLYLPFKSSV